MNAVAYDQLKADLNQDLDKLAHQQEEFDLLLALLGKHVPQSVHRKGVQTEIMQGMARIRTATLELQQVQKYLDRRLQELGNGRVVEFGDDGYPTNGFEFENDEELAEETLDEESAVAPTPTENPAAKTFYAFGPHGFPLLEESANTLTEDETVDEEELRIHFEEYRDDKTLHFDRAGYLLSS